MYVPNCGGLHKNANKDLHISLKIITFAAEIIMSMYSNSEKIEWTLIFVAEFGKKFGLTLKQAFNYLTRYKGIDFIDKHYDYVHTQSFQSMINDISEYCQRKGGELA